MSVRAHRDAVIVDLEGRLPGSVFKSYSKATGATGADGKPLTRWAVVFIALSRKDRPRYTGKQSRHVYTVTVHSVGVDEDSSLWVGERVDALTGRRLTVPGRSLFPVEYVTGQPPDLDDYGPRPLWFTVSQFDFVSDPA